MTSLGHSTRKHGGQAWNRVSVGPAALASVSLLLVIGSTLRFRRRDPFAALAGDADAQVLFELALWAIVAVWALQELLREPGWLTGRIPADLGPAVRAFTVVGGALIASALLAGEVFGLVRSGQYVFLAVLVILVQRELAADRLAWPDVWLWWRRMLWVLVIGATALTLALPMFEPMTAAGRLRWFAVHPIPTGGMIGLGLLALAGSYYGLPDPLFRKPSLRLLRILTLAGFVVALVLTRSRGPLFAAVAGLVVLGLCSPRPARRMVAALGGLTATALLVLGVGAGPIVEHIQRGQTTEQLASLTGRSQLFAYAWQLFGERPLFGHGYGSARSLYLEQFPWAGESHNAGIEIIVSLGVVGAVLFAWLLWRVTAGLLRGVQAADVRRRACAAEALAVVVFLLFMGVIAEGFAGRPGYEPITLAVMTLAADASRRGPP